VLTCFDNKLSYKLYKIADGTVKMFKFRLQISGTGFYGGQFAAIINYALYGCRKVK
jgi:hypothetical protein